VSIMERIADAISEANIHEKAHVLTDLLLSGFRREIDEISGITVSGEGQGELAIMYSGGLDSAVISMLSRMTGKRDCTVLHTFGVEGSRDRVNAMQGSAFIDVEWVDHVLTEDDILQGANGLLGIVPDLSFLELSYELPLYFGAREIESSVIITGQGADELFGGYARYRETDDPLLQRMMLDKDRVKLFTRTRDVETRIVSHFGKKLVTPYLDDAVIEFSSGLQLEELFDCTGGNKRILRESARILGLPEAVCSRPKLAAQYGSGISKVLKRLRKRGSLELAESRLHPCRRG
jgi:asparagine synthase (glutamine-hydrolysing)